MGFGASTLQFSLTAPLWARLKARARQLKVTRFNLLLCSYAVLVHRLAGQNDLVFGIPFSLAAQSHARMLGDTDNPLPLPIRIHPAANLATTAQRHPKLPDPTATHPEHPLGHNLHTLSPKRKHASHL